MPVEIINLLSSPDVAASTDGKQATTKPNLPSRGLDYGALDVDPKTWQPPLKKAVQLNVPSKRPADDPPGEGKWYSSDDFDTTGDLDERPGLVPPKKPRLSGYSHPSTSSRAASNSYLGISESGKPLQSIGTSRHNRVEPIDASSPPCRLPKTSKLSSVLVDDSPSTLVSLPPPGGQENQSTRNSLQRADVGTDYLDHNPFSSSSPPRPAPRFNKKSTAWDPISSSAPQESHRDDHVTSSSRVLRRSCSDVIAIEDSDNSQAENFGVPSDEDNEFPEISQIQISKRNILGLVPSRKRVNAAISNSPKQAKPSRISTSTDRHVSKDPDQEKTQNAAVKQAAKERKQREKEEVKRLKALEKEKAAALKEVNKSGTDKNNSIKEIIVCLPASLNPAILRLAEQLLQDLQVQTNRWTSPVDNVVKWRRKVTRRYNDEKDHWEPVSHRIETEMHTLSVLPAAEFVKLALGQVEGIPSTQGSGPADLEAHVGQMRHRFPGHTLIYLIEGLTKWMQNNRNVRNRQFQSAVRNGLGTEGPPGPACADTELTVSSSQPQRRKTKANQPQEYIDEERMEDALLQLQVLHGVLIHHTTGPEETARWLVVFTQHISTAPYRKQRNQALGTGAGFCMEKGQVKTGVGARDTYVHMLQEVARITAPIAYGVAAEFETVSKLVRGLETSGPLLLETVRKSANKDGAYTDRPVGQAVSKRLYKIFTTRDETSTDI